MTEQHSLIPMSPGERLREARETRGWSLAKVARRLRCNEAVLEAIEADNHTRLAPIYQQGFTRRYAELMDIPAEEVRGWGQASSDPAQTVEVRSIFPDAPPPSNNDRWLKATSYVLGSLLVGTLAWQMTHEAVRLSQRGNDAQATLSQPLTRQNEENEGHVNASIAALESLRPSGSRTGGAGQRAWAAMDAPVNETLAEGEYRLQLSASADSWVEIRDRDGELLEQDLVRAGSERAYRGFGPFRITFGRASAMQLRVNGEPVDITPFSQDDVTQMLLDPAALAGVADAANGD